MENGQSNHCRQDVATVATVCGLHTLEKHCFLSVDLTKYYMQINIGHIRLQFSDDASPRSALKAANMETGGSSAMKRGVSPQSLLQLSVLVCVSGRVLDF